MEAQPVHYMQHIRDVTFFCPSKQLLNFLRTFWGSSAAPVGGGGGYIDIGFVDGLTINHYVVDFISLFRSYGQASRREAADRFAHSAGPGLKVGVKGRRR